jgi:hypothetical protein
MLFSSRAAFAYHGRLSSMDTSTPEARLARLRQAEKILDEAAEDEAAGHSWFAHIGGDAVTLAGSFVLWAGYHRYGSGWLNLIAGTFITEAQIFTHPSAAIRARKAYREGRLSLPPAAFTWTLAPAFGGLTLLGTF